MAILYVPPPEFITENPERTPALRAGAEEFVRARLAELGIQAAPRRIESRGAFRGLVEHSFPGKRDAILFPLFLLPPGPKQDAEFLRMVAFVWKDDCTLAGVTWEAGAAPIPSMARELRSSNVPLTEISRRVFEGKNVVRWESHAEGPWGRRTGTILEGVGGERLASARIPVSSTLTRLACKWVPPPEIPAPPSVAPPMTPSAAPSDSPSRVRAEGAYPRRAHRILHARLRESPSPRGQSPWPVVSHEVFLSEGIFGARKQLITAGTVASPFSPVTLAAEVGARLASGLQDVRANAFKILRRRGRWIYLDHGRAFGLEVGIHLLGPAGAKLHVIHFAPEEEGADVAVALVRSEDPASPLKAGDTLSVDGTQYPPAAPPRLETNPL